MTATFRLLPQRVGRIRGAVATGEDRVTFSQFVYP